MSFSSSSNENITRNETTTNVDNRQYVMEGDGDVTSFDLSTDAANTADMGGGNGQGEQGGGGSGDGGGNINVNYTDQGAIEAGQEIATRALDANERTNMRSLDFGSQALDTVYASQREATNVARRAIGSVESTSDRAMSLVDAANRPESARSFDNVLKWGIPAGVILGLGSLWIATARG